MQAYEFPEGRDFRLVVENNNTHHAYVRLLDPEWEKNKVIITVGEMDDPTIGHRPTVEDMITMLLPNPTDSLPFKNIYLWSPAVLQHLDLYTLHIYEDEGKDKFNGLRILTSAVDPFQTQPVIIYKVPFDLTRNTRISFVVPAFTKVVMDLLECEFYTDPACTSAPS